MTLSKIDGGTYISDAAKGQLATVDCIIFDCDGVLIDIRASYDLAIKKTADYILRKLAKIPEPIEIDPGIIDGFKSTGGFNDEVDLTYAAILSVVAANSIGEDQSGFLSKVIQNADHTGIISVEKYLGGAAGIVPIKSVLGHPGKRGEDTLYMIFDQFFYGPDLFSKLYNRPSSFSERGLIENEEMIIDGNLLSQLRGRAGKRIAIITGRGLESIRHTMGSLLDEFDLDNSFFLEDEPRELAKPNPAPLIRAVSGMHSGHCLYVGDSFEDLIMAKRATDSGKRVTFCGITGTSGDPQGKLELFEKNGASIILDSISLLPKVLNRV